MTTPFTFSFFRLYPLYLFFCFLLCLDPPFNFIFLSLLDVTYYPDVFLPYLFFFFCYVDWGSPFTGVKRYIPCAI